MSCDIHPLTDIFNFWFTDAKQFWFDSTIEFDETVKRKYLDTLNNFSMNVLSKNILSQIQDDYRKSIGLIILHDQIPRHIYRNVYDKINYYLDLILSFSTATYTRFKYDLQPEHYCFVLLPLRHTNNFDNIMYVITETKILIKRNPNVQEYKRFFKATLERYIKLNNDKENISEYIPTMKQYIEDPTQICTCELRKYYTTPFIDIDIKILPEYIKNMFNTIKINIPIKKGIISLSGGVDSMVLSYILKYIGIDIIAIHINYNNRPECEDECNILKQWCSMLDVKLYIRKITEIQRPEMMELNMRDLYESYTRDIRFNTYMFANDEYENNVFLGHNHDDQFENIFTNIVSESHFDNLRGMTYNTQLKFKDAHINFIRPMLDIPKENIYKFASYFSIPHFKDSTPKWSQRGKIRDVIRPNMLQWDERSINSFFKLSDTISELMIIAEISASNIILQINKDKQLEINLNELYPKSLFKIIFEKIEIRLSQKGLNCFYDKMIYIKQNKMKYKINAIEKYALTSKHLIKWKNISDNNIILYFT